MATIKPPHSKWQYFKGKLSLVERLPDCVSTWKRIAKKQSKEKEQRQKRNYSAKEKFADNAKSVMIKHLNGWKMSKKVDPGCKICVKHFAGTKTKCMKDYMQPSLKNPANLFTLHVGTNDFGSEETAESIANTIINLATSLKNDQHGVSISNVLLRTDNANLNEKG